MSVTLRNLGADAVIAIGSNLGDRAAIFAAAVRELADTRGVELRAVSTPIETVAVRPDGEDPEAPAYLNGVALIRSSLSPRSLLTELHRIEQTHGRVRGERWGDRTLDLDIVEYGGMRLATDDLTLPHPRAHERTFVLRPWLEVDPDAVLTGRGRVADLLADLEETP